MIENMRNLTKSIWIFTVALAFLFGYFTTNGTYIHRSPQVHANVFLVWEHVGGSDVIEGGNVITNLGENYVRDLVGFLNDTSPRNTTSCISLGNASAAATLTKLAQEATAAGIARQNGTITAWNNGTDYAFNVSKTWTLTAAANINATGLHYSNESNSDNNMFAVADLTETTFASGDNCTVTWIITWDAN